MKLYVKRPTVWIYDIFYILTFVRQIIMFIIIIILF